MIDLKNVAASTKQNEQEDIGKFLFYTVGEQLVNRNELRHLLSSAGLDEGFMPAKIRIPDAFRRATSAVERKGERPDPASGVVNNYLIKEVSSDNKQVTRFIVKETKDSKGKRLEYNPQVAKMVLDKETGYFDYLVWDNEGIGIASRMCEEAKDYYSLFQTHHDGRAILSMVSNIVRSMAATPLRPYGGGDYFVPIKFKSTVNNLVTFLNSLEGNSEGYTVAVRDDENSRDFVRSKLQDRIKDTLGNLAKSLKDPNLNKSHGNPKLREAKELLQDFSAYQEALGEDLENMGDMVGLVKKQMLAMVDKLSA